MSDAAFVSNARKSWKRVLAMQDKPDVDGTTLALAVAVWATVNVDKLLDIAESAA